MPIPFDLEKAVCNGRGPERFSAAMILLGLRDGADHWFLEPDTRPGVIGAIVQLRINSKLHDYVPPPIDHVRAIAQFLSQRTVGASFGGGGFGGWLPVYLEGREFTVWLTVVSDQDAEHVSVQLPICSELKTVAERVLLSVLNEGGLMFFDDTDFE